MMGQLGRREAHTQLVCALFFGLVGLVASGCGAKTGLNVPDAGLDAGINGEGDAGERDAAVDAPPDAAPDAAVPEPPCIETPEQGGEPVEAALSTEARLGRADVAFLIDTTASMQDEIDRIRTQLRDQLAPAINESIPDAQLAVATFADFPIRPYGQSGEDLPFVLRLPSSNDLARAQAAVDGIELGDGRDDAESQVPALWHLATGEGFPEFVARSSGCPRGGFGYPCFRPGALPVVLMFTDAPFHNGPDNSRSYGPPPATQPEVVATDGRHPVSYDEAVGELRNIGAHVIGFNSGDRDSELDMERLAVDTDAVDAEGEPLVFDIGGRGRRLGTEVVDAIETFVDTVVFDIDAIVRDGDRTDAVDATEFVEEIVPLRADPADGVDSIDREANVFRQVRSGTQVVFELIVRNDAVVPGSEPQVFPLDVVFRGDGRARLGQRRVRIVVPAADGAGCDML